MGTVSSAALVLLLVGAVFLAVRSIRRRKGCGCGCDHCSGCSARSKKQKG